MRNRTRVMTAAVAVTAALTGSTAVAVASTSGSAPGPRATTTAQVKTAGGAKCLTPAGAAARAGVAPDRLEQAMRPAKASFRDGGPVSKRQFEDATARELGISPAQVHKALAGGSRQCLVKSAPSPADIRRAQAAMTAAVARELHVSTARASAALRAIFAAGHAHTQSASFVAAARSLGVSTQQLATALMQAKESLAPAAAR